MDQNRIAQRLSIEQVRVMAFTQAMAQTGEVGGEGWRCVCLYLIFIALKTEGTKWIYPKYNTTQLKVNQAQRASCLLSANSYDYKTT